MPFKYMGAVMFGNGLSGVMMNSLRAIIQLILPGDDNLFTMALIFFICGASFLLGCGLLFDPLFKNPYFLYYLEKSKKSA